MIVRNGDHDLHEWEYDHVFRVADNLGDATVDTNVAGISPVETEEGGRVGRMLGRMFGAISQKTKTQVVGPADYQYWHRLGRVHYDVTYFQRKKFSKFLFVFCLPMNGTNSARTTAIFR